MCTALAGRLFLVVRGRFTAGCKLLEDALLLRRLLVVEPVRFLWAWPSDDIELNRLYLTKSRGPESSSLGVFKSRVSGLSIPGIENIV